MPKRNDMRASTAAKNIVDGLQMVHDGLFELEASQRLLSSHIGLCGKCDRLMKKMVTVEVYNDTIGKYENV